MSVPALMSGQMRYILVVEADWNERFTLSMLLQRFGYTVASTSSANEAIEFLCVAPALAIFAEAGVVGADLLRQLKTDVRFRDVPVVVVTTEEDSGLTRSLKQGALAGLLRTPVNPHEVFQVIQKVVENGSREHIRIPTALPAAVHDGYGVTDGFITVLSQYGLFFRTLEPRPVKTLVDVTISFGDRSVDLRAVVLYLVTFEEGPFSEPGMGMKFVDVRPEDGALIRFFINEQLGAAFPSIEPGQA